MKRLFAALGLFLVSPLRAQITLEEFRHGVTEYSYSLKAAAARTAAAAATLEQVRTGYLPRLSMEGDFSLTARRYDGVERWTFGLLPQVVQTIYGGGAVRAEADRAGANYDIALCEEEFSRLDVRYAADYAYWNLSAARFYAAAMQRYVSIIVSLKEIIDRRFIEGYIAKGDVLMIDARLSEARYEQVAAEQSAEVALHNFNILRGADPAAEVVLAGGIRDSLPLPGRMSVDEAVERRPDYSAARLRGEQAEADIRIVRASFNPRIDVGLGGSWKPYTPNRTGATVLDASVFVGLSVPIFHWGERRHAVGAARARLLESEWAAAELYDDIVRSEMNGWTAVVQSRAQVDATEHSLAIASENLDISTYSYGEGLATILDVLQAQLSWIQLYTNSIRARYNYAVAISDYARITAADSGIKN